MQTVRAFRAAPVAAPARVTVLRSTTAQRLAVRSSRPTQLQSEFLAPVAGIKGLCASFAQLVMAAASKLAEAAGRSGLLVECNNKKGLGVTLRGTRRKRARVSGFRARMATPGGKKVLQARRKKGRKILVPAAVPKRKM